jgi:pentatricopeptide repeat-containing protein PET309
MLKKIATPGPDGFEMQRRHLHGASHHPYSTAQVRTQHEEIDVDEATVEQVKEEITATPKDPRAFEALTRFLTIREPGKQDLAWQLYAAIPTSSLRSDDHGELRANLLEYLNQDDDPAVPNRVLQVFDELPDDKLRASSYRAAIVAQISLRMMGPALELLEDAPRHKHFNFSNLGYDVIIRRTVLEEQWDLSLRVFRAFLDQNPVRGRARTSLAIQWGNAIPEIWRGVTTLRQLPNRLQSFLSHVREFQHEIGSSEENKKTLSLFVISFVPNVMEQVLLDPKLDEKATAHFFGRLFNDLEALKLPTSVCYEYAMKQLLKLPDDEAMREIPKLLLDLYARYRQLCLDSSGIAYAKPSLNLLRNLIVHYCDHGDLARAHELVQDHRIFYPKEPLRAGLLRYLIHCYADYGDMEQVEEYFGEFMTYYKNQVDLKLLSSLPFACARRADVQGANVQFNRIHGEFGLIPDAACWNVLLLAYARADDLDGALECFNTCIDSGIAPDLYTFGPMIDVCAQRGDVEAFEALFSRAEQMGVPLTQDIRARSGYVQVFLNAGDTLGAEAVAQGMLKSWRAGTLMGHTLTHTWNLLIQHDALNQDLAGARARYREMVKNNIPTDSWTFGSIMRALVEVKQTNAAFKLLRKTMAQNKLQPHALHYAIVMTGFLREGGGQVQVAMEVYNRMIEQGVAQTYSSREATIRTLGEPDSAKFRKRRLSMSRLEQVEQAVEDILSEVVKGQAILRQPKHTRQMDSRNHGANPQSYYGLLISMYATRGSYKLCTKLLQKAEAMAPNVDNYTVPMTLITGAMEAHFKAGEHSEVARYWELARTSASKLTQTFSQIMNPQAPTSENKSIVDPSIRARFEGSRISANRRNILFQAARYYVRSLLDPTNPNPDALDEAQCTMRDLLIDGYTLDVFTWNEFVQTLAQRGRLAEAFSTCEEYLMPSFPGWRNLYPTYIRKDRRGYQWMEFRHYEITRTSIMPRYKTLIILASAMQKVRSDERNGIGYDQSAGGWQRELLEEAAPLTVRAIETMPRTNDPLQTQYFHSASY